MRNVLVYAVCTCLFFDSMIVPRHGLMGEFTTRAGGRRHGGSEAPLVLVQRVVFSGDPGAITAVAPAGHSPIIRSLHHLTPCRARAGGDLITMEFTCHYEAQRNSGQVQRFVSLHFLLITPQPMGSLSPSEIVLSYPIILLGV